MESRRLGLLSTQTQREGNLEYEKVSRELVGENHRWQLLGSRIRRLSPPEVTLATGRISVQDQASHTGWSPGSQRLVRYITETEGCRGGNTTPYEAGWNSGASRTPLT